MTNINTIDPKKLFIIIQAQKHFCTSISPVKAKHKILPYMYQVLKCKEFIHVIIIIRMTAHVYIIIATDMYCNHCLRVIMDSRLVSWLLFSLFNYE